MIEMILSEFRKLKNSITKLIGLPEQRLYFPENSISDELKQLLDNKKITFSDLTQYPELRKYINEHSFGSEYSSLSASFVKLIGFKNAIRFFEENPEFVNAITGQGEESSSLYNEFNFITEKPLNKLASYKKAKQFIYGKILDKVKNGDVSSLPSLDIIPQEMIDSFSNVFIEKGELPEKVLEDYSNGELSLPEIRQYSELLKTKDIEFGMRSSSGRVFNKVFGNVWEFIEKVPREYDKIIEIYLLNNSYDDEKIEQISQQELSDIISDAIQYVFDNFSFSRKEYNLDELYAFSKYVPIEEILEEGSLRDFIQRFGFENIVKFNRRNNRILERPVETYSDTLLNEMLKYADVISEDVQITDEQQLENVFSQIIHQMRVSDYYNVKQSLIKNKTELSKLYPREFLDYNMLDELLKDMKEQDREKLIESLEIGFNGNTNVLFEILNENPFLLPVLVDKNLIIDNNNKKSNGFYQKIGSKKFLDIFSTYGPAILQIINYMGDENDKMEEFISQISGDNYEQQMNKYIYDMLGKSNGRGFDFRILPQSFKSEHPEFFLDENAPKDLQDAFYGKRLYGDNYTLLRAKDIKGHPEWIPFLMKVSLSKFLDTPKIKIYNSKEQDKNGNAYVQKMNLYEALGLKFSKEEILDLFSKYGEGMITYKFGIDVSLGKEEIYESIVTNIYNSIKDMSIFYDNKNMPREFIEKYPELFLDENAPEELQNLFYESKISPESIKSHPEWKQFLQGKEIGSACFMNIRDFVKQCIKLGWDNDKIFELFDRYGSYLEICPIIRDNINSDNINELDNIIRQQIAKGISTREVRYNESMRTILGQEYPELFLDENAPEELKDVFYNYNLDTPLTFEFLRQHKDWLSYLEGKNVLMSLIKGNCCKLGMQKLFDKYGQKEALRIGMKYPEPVMQMLDKGKVNLLNEWYDKHHFVPHHVVMEEFPIEQSDKYVASGKKWSQLMKIERHKINDDSMVALLKASMCFGVFDNDNNGFNKTMQLFSDIPKTLSQQDMQKIIDFIKKQISSLKSNPNPNMLENYNKQLELVQQSYGQSEEGIFSLKINSQQNKNTVQILRSIMEEANVSAILTPNKAHKLFDGFEMKYEPDFRDFILKNMDTILSSDEYIAYISSMQRQWPKIKAFNSNRVLTIDLVMDFIKSNKYENVQIGNEKLAKVSSMVGYDQKSFDILQQIYNNGKSRTFNSIPRVHTENGEYVYEILRLDDPLALAIGTLTDCCQALGNAAETSMEHSMVDKNGRVFVVKDEAGNIVAQSWVWRNQNVLCFDNIEIPTKAFTRAERGGISKERFSDTIFALYQQAGQELIAKDEEEFQKLLDEGKVTKKQYEALKLGKVTVGKGYNSIADSLRRNSQLDRSKVARPLDFRSLNNLRPLYIDDSKSQYVIAGQQDVPISTYETPTIYSDEFIIHDNGNTKKQDLLMLQNLKLVRGEDGYFEEEETEKNVSNIADNYGLTPEKTRIIRNANFAIIYEITNEEVIIGDILYNTSFDNDGKQIDISDKVVMQIRMAIEQIGVKGKKFNMSRLSQEKLEMYNKAMKLETEIDEERGLSHGSR